MLLKEFNDTKLKNAKTYAEKKGFQNEKDIAYLLDFEFKNSETTAVLHDLRFEYNGRVAQIDHLIINNFYIYVIESKFFSGEIEITENGNWIINYENKKISIESPILQNKRHISVLEDLFKNEKIIPKNGSIPEIINVIMISNKTQVKGKLPKEVIYADAFLKGSFDMRVNLILTKPWKALTIGTNTFKDEELKDVCNNLLKYDTLSQKEIKQKNEEINLKELFKNEIELLNTKEINKRELFNKLKKLRLEISIKEKIAPFTVFTNKTLEDIVEKQPKTKEEMLKISGVGEIKFEKYGKEFLKIILEIN
jgi:hypothetical protein